MLHGVSPYEKLHNAAPSLEHTRTMGCLCYVTEPNPSNKFSPRAIPIASMGYSSTQKGYKLYDLHSHLFFVSRDVHFRENLFPFQSSSTTPSIPQSSDMSSYFFDSDSAPSLSEPTSSNSSLSPSSPPHISSSPIPSSIPITVSPKCLSRATIPPIWLSTYVQPHIHSRPSTSHSINSVVHYSHLSSEYQAFLSKFSPSIEPQHYSKAILDD